MLVIKGKTGRIDEELIQLKLKNLQLYDLICAIGQEAADCFDKFVTITHIFRKQKEQDHLYKGHQRYDRKKFKSPHQFWHGVDLRSGYFTDYEVQHLVDFANARNDKDNYYKWTAVFHDVGHGEHIHIQFAPKE